MLEFAQFIIELRVMMLAQGTTQNMGKYWTKFELSSVWEFDHDINKAIIALKNELD